MPQTEPSILRVEGKDDFHAINHLLLRHGIDCAKIPVDIKSADGGDETTGGRNALLDLMQTEVMTNTNRSVGFILDADEDAKDRWSAVCARLRNVGIRLPDEIPQDGFVGKATMVQAHVGVWLMPDNRRSGALEEFLEDLVRNNDTLLPIAEQSTADAKARGARFPHGAQPRPCCTRGSRGKRDRVCPMARPYAPATSVTTAPPPWRSSSGLGACS